MRKQVAIFSYGLVCSLALGTALGGFYLLQGTLIGIVGIGRQVRPVFNAVWLVLVGALIYFCQRCFGQLPKPLGQIKAELANHGASNYRFLPLQFVLPALILTSGTSLGPEATLVSTTCLGGLWLQDKLRFLDAHWAALTPAKRWQALLMVWRYRMPRAKAVHRHAYWSPAMVSYLAMGIASFYLTCKFGGEPSVIVYLGRASLDAQAWWWLVPIFGLGRLAGALQLKAMILLRRVLLSRIRRDWSQWLIGGLAIYAASVWLPAINCSGMANFHLLATSWQHQSVGFLLIAAVAKLALLTICLNTGWIGGDIFPVLFCATAEGIALSQVLPVAPVPVIAVFAIAVGGTVLESPLVAGGVMAVMFLPPNLLPLCLVVIGLLLLCDHGPRLAKSWFSDGLRVPTVKNKV